MFHRVRTTLSDTAALVDGLAPRIAGAARGWVLFLPAYAITTGSAMWAFTHRTELTKLDGNKLTVPQSYSVLWWVLGALVGLLFFYCLAMLWMRRRTGAWRVVSTATLLNERLFPLLALPVLPALLVPGVERDSPKLTFFLIAIFTAIVVKGAYAWVEPAGRERGERAAKLAAGLSVGAIWLGYGALFSFFSIINHHVLNTRTIDLGYYDNIFYQSIHGRPLGCSLLRGGYHGSAHFDPLLVLLSPLYLIYPRAELLLVLQAFWMGAGVLPVYLIAKDKLGRRLPAVGLALMYALYPALQGATMYEFHSLSLLSTILLWLLYFLERGSTRGYFAALAIALLCREDASLVLCFVGLYAIVSGRPLMPRLGWITIFVSMTYLAIVKRFFMSSGDLLNTGKDSFSFAYYYSELIPNKNGVVGLVLSAVTNPVYVLKVVFAEPKVMYLLTLFVPLLFLPFLARSRRVMLGYGLLFTLLATRSAVFSPAFQYSSTILPFAFALTPAALAQIADSRLVGQMGLDSRRYARALLVGALAASLLVSWKFGGIVENQSFHGGFVRIARGMTPQSKATYAWIREQVAKIPPGASVGTTNKLGPHVSNRKDVFFYHERPGAEYHFVDETELRAPDLETLTKGVKQGTFVELGRREKLVLFKKSK